MASAEAGVSGCRLTRSVLWRRHDLCHHACMSDNKTRPTPVDPYAFVAAVDHPRRREDGRALLTMMREVTGEEPVMWGPTIVGFGTHHYVYESGREGDSPCVGFSPRKASLSLYGLTSAPESRALLPKLGKHKVGAACLYVNKLSDVDETVLRELTAIGYQYGLRTSGGCH